MSPSSITTSTTCQSSWRRVGAAEIAAPQGSNDFPPAGPSTLECRDDPQAAGAFRLRFDWRLPRIVPPFARCGSRFRQLPIASTRPSVERGVHPRERAFRRPVRRRRSGLSAWPTNKPRDWDESEGGRPASAEAGTNEAGRCIDRIPHVPLPTSGRSPDEEIRRVSRKILGPICPCRRFISFFLLAQRVFSTG